MNNIPCDSFDSDRYSVWGDLGCFRPLFSSLLFTASDQTQGNTAPKPKVTKYMLHLPSFVTVKIGEGRLLHLLCGQPTSFFFFFFKIMVAAMILVYMIPIQDVYIHTLDEKMLICVYCV